MAHETPFKPGVELAFYHSSNWGLGLWETGLKVEKVYKNGNFKIEGIEGQWRPWQGSMNRWCADKTGRHFGRRRRIAYHLTDEVREIIRENEETVKRARLYNSLQQKIENKIKQRTLTLDELKKVGELLGINVDAETKEIV